MEDSKSKTFEVGKFYRICSDPVYPNSERRDIPHLVVRKTKMFIVFDHLVKSYLDGTLYRNRKRFRFSTDNGTEEAFSTEKWSMIPFMRPDNPCDKPKAWDSVTVVR